MLLTHHQSHHQISLHLWRLNLDPQLIQKNVAEKKDAKLQFVPINHWCQVNHDRFYS